MAVVLLLLVSAPASARGWWRSTCDLLLGASRAEPTEEMRDVASSWSREIARENRYWAHRFHSEIGPAPELKGAPLVVQVRVSLVGRSWFRPPFLNLIVKPDGLNGKWQDGHSTDLCSTQPVMLIFEDLPVGPVGRRMSEWMREEFDHVVARSSLDVRLKFQSAETLGLGEHAAGKTVAWLEGNVQNFQYQRLFLLMIQYAVSQAANDSLLAHGEEPHQGQ